MPSKKSENNVVVSLDIERLCSGVRSVTYARGCRSDRKVIYTERLKSSFFSTSGPVRLRICLPRRIADYWPSSGCMHSVEPLSKLPLVFKLSGQVTTQEKKLLSEINNHPGSGNVVLDLMLAC